MSGVVDDFVMVEAEDAGVHHDHGTPSYLTSISEIVDNLSSTLRSISLKVHDNPELGYKEYIAHDTLTTFFSSQPGWKVTPHAYNIPTAFIATYSSTHTGPVVSFNAEYDALPTIGHACGHNLICIASVGAALATATILSQHTLPGTVTLFGTPAEEGGGGKIALLNAGAYTDHNVDVSLISHPGITADSALMRTAAYTAFKVEYHGKEAHAAAAPWEGVNALDALVTAYNGISVLRQQTRPGDIVQGMITHGGVKPNIIHAYAAGRFVVRSTTRARRDGLRERVQKCFEAGATATAARLVITPGGEYDDHVPNWTLGARYRQWFNALGGRIEAPELDVIRGQTMASTDQGNVSYAVPSLSAGFWIRSEGEDGGQKGGPHTPDFAEAARTEEAHGLALRVAKALAATAVDVLSRKGLLEEVKKEFEDMKKADGARS